MPTYRAPVEDTLFVLRDVLGYERHSNLPGFADASPDVLEAILGEAAKLAENVMLPLNRVGDLEGCHRKDDGSVEIGPREGFGGPQPTIILSHSDEQEKGKSRLHIDVNVTDRDQDAELYVVADLDTAMQLLAVPEGVDATPGQTATTGGNELTNVAAIIDAGSTFAAAAQTLGRRRMSAGVNYHQ